MLFKKKGQADAFGLIFIVGVIVFIMFFMLVLGLNSEENTLVAENKMNSMSTNTLVALFRTNIKECHFFSLNDLVADCHKNPPTIKCGAYDSCFYLNKTIGDYLNETLDVWNENYELRIDDLSEPIYFEGGNCADYRIGATRSMLHIPTLGDTVEVELKICE